MQGFALSALDVGILVTSIVLVVGVGWLAGRKQDKTARGYFLASGRLPWYIIGAAFVSTSVSSEQIVGTVGQAYRGGMGVANWEWWSLPCYAVMIVLFIPMFLRSRITTIPEFLTRRFGPLCGTIYGVTMLFAYIFVFLVVVFYSGAKALSGLTGWDFQIILWMMVVLVGLYAIKGGLASVMWTDAVQCAMLVGGGVVLFLVALARVPGGWAAMAAASPDRFHLVYPATDPTTPFLGMWLGTLGVFTFYQAGNQVMVQRVLGARSTWDGMMGIVFAGLINMVRPLVTCFLGLIVYHWIDVMHQAPPLASPDDAFAFGMKTFAPEWGLRGIILAGFVAAVMSTISALANSTATIFSLDVYHRFIDRAADDRRLVLVGRLAALFAMVLAAGVAPVVASVGIFKYFQMGVTYLAVPFITVVFFGLLWKRANYASAIFGMLGGMVVLVGVIVLNWQLRVHGVYARIGWPGELHWIYQGFIAQVLISVGIVAVALRTPPPAPAQWEPFLWRPSLLAAYGEGAARPWYQNLWLWFAVFAVLWVGVYIRFW